MLKQELREAYKKKRMTLSDDEAILLSEKIIHRFLNDFKPVAGQKIHLFLPIAKFKEINTFGLLNYCKDHQSDCLFQKLSERK
jgi:5-formyltetrahydrofolate cyclo-ligase